MDLADTGERLIPELHAGSLAHGEHVARYACALPIVKNKDVLDIACGTGYGATMLAQEAKSVVGVDLSEESIEYASRHYSGSNITYKVGDAIKIPLESQSIDVVVSMETIEHIPQYRKFLTEVKRILRPGGLLIVSTPNDDEFPEGNEYHVHEFKTDEFEGLMKDSFKHFNIYYQGVWFSTGVLSPENYVKDWDKVTRVQKISHGSPKRSTYMIAVCSDQSLAEIAETIVVADYWSARDQQFHEQTQRNVLAEVHERLETTRRDLGRLEDLQDRYDDLLARHTTVVNSRGYQWYEKGKAVYHKVRHAVRRPK